MPPSFRPVRPHTDSWSSQAPQVSRSEPCVIRFDFPADSRGRRKGVPGPLKEREAKRNGHGRNQPRVHPQTPPLPAMVAAGRREGQGGHQADPQGSKGPLQQGVRRRRVEADFEYRSEPQTPFDAKAPRRPRQEAIVLGALVATSVLLAVYFSFASGGVR